MVLVFSAVALANGELLYQYGAVSSSSQTESIRKQMLQVIQKSHTYETNKVHPGRGQRQRFGRLL